MARLWAKVWREVARFQPWRCGPPRSSTLAASDAPSRTVASRRVEPPSRIERPLGGRLPVQPREQPGHAGLAGVGLVGAQPVLERHLRPGAGREGLLEPQQRERREAGGDDEHQRAALPEARPEAPHEARAPSLCPAGLHPSASSSGLRTGRHKAIAGGAKVKDGVVSCTIAGRSQTAAPPGARVVASLHAEGVPREPAARAPSTEAGRAEMYAVGDNVVYPCHGAGKIVKIEQRDGARPAARVPHHRVAPQPYDRADPRGERGARGSAQGRRGRRRRRGAPGAARRSHGDAREVARTLQTHPGEARHGGHPRGRPGRPQPGRAAGRQGPAHRREAVVLARPAASSPASLGSPRKARAS